MTTRFAISGVGLPLRLYTDKYIEAFLADRQLLNLEEPEHLVRATDTISEMLKLIQTLVDKGLPTQARVNLLQGFGVSPLRQLAHVDFSGVRDGARWIPINTIRKMPRLRAVESRQGRRAFLGDAVRSRPARLAH